MAAKIPTGGSTKKASMYRQDRAMASRGGSQPVKKKTAKKAQAASISKNNMYVASGYGTKHVTGQSTGRKTVDRSKKKAIKTALGNVIALPKNAGMDNRRPMLAKKIARGRATSRANAANIMAQENSMVAKKASLKRQESAAAKRGVSKSKKAKSSSTYSIGGISFKK